MAPSRQPRENQYLFNVGEVGRKTGLRLPDTGIRDENGMEPMDHLFSSPEKAKSPIRTNGTRQNADATISSEADMSLEESTMPEPVDVLSARRASSVRLPPPRSNSPRKTFLQSPARRGASLGSPLRGSVAPRAASTTAPVRRKLDFSQNNEEEEEEELETPPQKQTSKAKGKHGVAALSKDTRLAPVSRAYTPEDNFQNGADETTGFEEDVLETTENDMQMVNGGEDETPEPEIDEPEEPSESEPEPAPVVKKGKSKVQNNEEVAVVAGAKRGRKPKTKPEVIHEEPEQSEPEEESRPAKRTRRSLEGVQPAKKTGRPKKAPVQEEEQAEEVQAPAKHRGRPKRIQEPEAEAEPDEEPEEVSVVEPAKQKGRKSKEPAAAKAPKARGPRPKMPTIDEGNSLVITTGPPIPKLKQGLMMLRRETPMEGAGQKTRSGRSSVAPLKYWEGEKFIYDHEEVGDEKNKFYAPKINAILRAEEIPQPKLKKHKHSKSGKSKKRPKGEPESEDDDDMEEWELEPGHITGLVTEWNSATPMGSEEQNEEEIALSSKAIITRDIAGATFRFAKTLTLPFFGSGMVDLPPGGAKKPKNSRRMHMAFFVFYGRVEVMVNNNKFTISKGGTWQVPRGNWYSIENNFDNPARIFFSQGCEIQAGSGSGKS